MRTKTIAILLVLLAVLAFGGIAGAQDGPVRVAVVMPSSITDLAWSQAIYDGLLEVQAELGGEEAMEIAYTEGMFDVTAAGDALRDYADEGYDLVIAHGTQFGSTLFELATDYPETSFAWGTATETADNIFAYEAAAEQGGYVNGVMAGNLTEANIIGIVGPVPAGDGLLYINGFIQGVQASNPDAEVLLAYTGSFGDTAAAAEVAQTQLAAGADVFSGSAQQVVGAIEVIQAAGGKWFGTQSDQSAGWADTVVASQVYDWAPVIMDMLENRANGTLGGIAYNLTLENEGLTFAYGEAEGTAELEPIAQNAIAEIVAGQVYPMGALPEEQFRVAIVMPSSITDLAWSQSIYDGLVDIQTQLGGESVMEIAYTEGMFDVTAAGDALRDYADEGYDLVIAHGTQFGSTLFELATDYPETSFAWGTATETADNIFAYEAAAEQGGYINGVMAGMMTEANTIGIVGPVAAGDALLYINGFIQGAEATNADAEILLAYTGSFGDTAAAAEVAQTQLAAGADVFTGSAQQVVGAIEVIQAAEGVWFGTQSDQSAGWADTVVSSQVYNWGPVIAQMIENNLTGTLGGVAYNLTLANGGLQFAFGEVEIPEDVVSAVNDSIVAIESGDIVVSQSLEESE